VGGARIASTPSGEPGYSAPEGSLDLTPTGPRFRINGQWSGNSAPRVLQIVDFEGLPENEIVFEQETEALVMKYGGKLYRWCACSTMVPGDGIDFSTATNSFKVALLLQGLG
jgi:hypothetical protein